MRGNQTIESVMMEARKDLCTSWKPRDADPPRDHGTGGGPQPYVQHCCGTCGHHRGRKSFEESCPRLGELLFRHGTKSAKVLMEETSREGCKFWFDPKNQCPYLDKGYPAGCFNLHKNCPKKTNKERLTVGCIAPVKEEEKSPEEIFEESHEKNISLKGFKKDTPEWFSALTASKRASCPGWHWEVWKISPKKNAEWLYEGARSKKEANEIKDRLESDESRVGCRFEVRKRPDEIEESPKAEQKAGKKPAKTPKPYTIYIKQSDGAHPLIVSCDAQGHGGTSNPCDTREEVIKRALVTLEGFVQYRKKPSPTLAKKSRPVTVETTLFIDKTGMFTTADFFSEDGTPRAPAPEKRKRSTKKKMEEPES
jgi:hypothetical protein